MASCISTMASCILATVSCGTSFECAHYDLKHAYLCPVDSFTNVGQRYLYGNVSRELHNSVLLQPSRTDQVEA